MRPGVGAMSSGDVSQLTDIPGRGDYMGLTLNPGVSS